MLLETKPEVVSFHFGLPASEIVQTIKSAGIFVLSSATTVAEARLLERGGVDAVIARRSRALTSANNPACFHSCPKLSTPCAFRS
jgi:NAD(P)H-dependent flavin oxidoreductase YrpB (nitropropane dioxygenase family)